MANNINHIQKIKWENLYFLNSVGESTSQLLISVFLIYINIHIYTYIISKIKTKLI